LDTNSYLIYKKELFNATHMNLLIESHIWKESLTL